MDTTEEKEHLIRSPASTASLEEIGFEEAQRRRRSCSVHTGNPDFHLYLLHRIQDLRHQAAGEQEEEEKEAQCRHRRGAAAVQT
ncbi:hypothetical protein PIB30_003193, partial [Stylosanthes scabra]|nr:hypothetical protein [Stylosanthes scabra]